MALAAAWALWRLATPPPESPAAAPGSAREREPAARAGAEAESPELAALPPGEAGAPLPVDPDQGEAAHAGEEAIENAADLALYARRPMSAVPHRVVRGWGASGGGQTPGVVGAYVVVEPGLSNQALADLCRDIRSYHAGAEALAVRVLDSEQAVRYDRHTDGGALAARHLVAMVSRNRELGVDAITVRGAPIEP